MTLAAALPTPPSDGDFISIKLNARSATAKDFLLYTYSFTSSFTIVGGVESGAALKALRYDVTGTQPDIVDVFVNGVKQQRGTAPAEYQLYDGTPTSPVAPNTVLFNQPISPRGTTQVDVVVSRPIVAESRTISFTRYEADEARLSSGGWENVSYVERLVGSTVTRFYLFSFDFADDTTLASNTIYVPAADDPLLNSTTPVSASSCFLLLSSPPHTQLDRIVTSTIDLTVLRALGYLREETVDGASRLLVPDTTVTPVYPPLRVPVAALYLPELPLTQSRSGAPLETPSTKVVGPAV